MHYLDASTLGPRDTACSRDSHVHHTETLGSGAVVSGLTSSAEGMVCVFKIAQVDGVTASVCRMARPAL